MKRTSFDQFCEISFLINLLNSDYNDIIFFILKFYCQTIIFHKILLISLSLKNILVFNFGNIGY